MKKLWLYLTTSLLFLSLFLFPLVCSSADDGGKVQATMIVSDYDHKSGLLFTFFNKYRCPGDEHISEYLKAADKDSVDWRLLPAISIAESSCGRHQLYNNWWGYGSARSLKKFKTVDEGIDYVELQLETNRAYKGFSNAKILQNYGPHPDNKPSPTYYKKVLKLIGEISPKE